MKYSVNIMLFLCVFLILQGCNDILDNPQPSDALSNEVTLNDPGAVASIRASMYDHFHDREMSTRWLLAPAAAADLTDIRPSAGRFDEYNNNQLRVGMTDAGGYGELYDTINDANILISGIPDGVISDALATQFRGEGLFIRAMATHHLVRTLGYEPGQTPPAGSPGAGFNLGIILRTEPVLDVSAADLKSRATVQEVYTQIEADLNEAINLLDNSNMPNFASQAAAQALMARVKQYQRQWAEADDFATDALSAPGVGLADETEVADIFDETSGGTSEPIFKITTNPSTESAGVNQALSAYTAEQWHAQIPTQKLLDLYEAGDARRAGWYGRCINEEQNDAFVPGCGAVNADTLELQKYASEQGQFADDYIHLRAAEMVLIQAEARLNTTGPAAAVERLDALRAARGVGPYAGALTTAAVMDEILDERARELVAEGHRFYDFKRLGRDIEKPTGVPALPFTSIRILDDIPPEEIEINPDLVQNPGY